MREIAYDCGYKDGAYDGYNLAKDDFKKLFEAVSEVCSWDWEEIFGKKYVEEELEKDLVNLQKQYKLVKGKI